MSATIYAVGSQGETKGLAPTDTNEATLFVAGNQYPVAVELWITNSTGSAANATVKWGDGSTDYVLYGTNAVAANTTFHTSMYLPLLKAGSTIKVTSGTGNAITFTMVFIATGGTGNRAKT